MNRNLLFPLFVAAAAVGVALRCQGSAETSAAETSAAAATTNPFQNVHGVFLGLDAYPQSPLPNCVNDAADMRALMAARGVPAANLHLVPEKRCTKAGMLRVLRGLATTVPAEGTLLVYYSGHGSRELDRNGDEPDGIDESWVSIDMEHVLDDELDEVFATMKCRVIVISDSCHAGTVSKDVELPLEGQLGKYLPNKVLAEHHGRPDELRPRDIGVESRRRREEQNAQGGSYSGEGGLDTRVGLFASCSDDEVSNASRNERNSAFTADLLVVLQDPRIQTFEQAAAAVTARLRNRSLRYPQNPVLFQIDASQRMPQWLAAVGEAAQEPATEAIAEDVRTRISSVIEGLWQREDAAPNARRNWIAKFSTPDGKTALHTGDELRLQVTIAKDAPSLVHLCVFNVGPTGNLTLLYPNAFDGNRPLAPGATLELGYGASEVYLPLKPPAGEESLVAFALEWNPFEGVDFTVLENTSHAMVSVAAPVRGRSAAETRGALLRARDIGVEPRRARPGEGWDRAVLTVSHR